MSPPALSDVFMRRSVVVKEIWRGPDGPAPLSSFITSNPFDIVLISRPLSSTYMPYGRPNVANQNSLEVYSI